MQRFRKSINALFIFCLQEGDDSDSRQRHSNNTQYYSQVSSCQLFSLLIASFVLRGAIEKWEFLRMSWNFEVRCVVSILSDSVSLYRRDRDQFFFYSLASILKLTFFFSFIKSGFIFRCFCFHYEIKLQTLENFIDFPILANLKKWCITVSRKSRNHCYLRSDWLFITGGCFIS